MCAGAGDIPHPRDVFHTLTYLLTLPATNNRRIHKFPSFSSSFYTPVLASLAPGSFVLCMRHMYKTRSIRLAGCLALAGPAFLPRVSSAVAHEPTQSSAETGGSQQQRLAVVVPAYRGDLERVVSSLGRWPSTCSPVTEQNVDLVLYYAEGEEDSAAVEAAFDVIAASAGRCFSKTKTVFAHLEKEEDAYPKGPSVMFYKMFLDEGVRSELFDYDALAIMEWDVLVATENSFEELYHAAFRGNEDFWVKGSNLEGTNFHSSATVSEMWHVLGHINGNAIYNNNDPAFVEYVDYTRTRWSYTYPYDVALWLTISDFPYSWPLYQRYSNKFVTTNLIAYVGHDHVDHTTVSDAIAGKTLFIHGSSVDEGNIASIKATKSEKKKHNKTLKKKHKTTKTSQTRQRHRLQRKLQKWRDNQRWKTLAKWQGDADNDAEPRWKREEKWKGNNDDTDDSDDSDDLPRWKKNQKWKSNVCDDGCESDDGDTGRVCDTTCKDGDPYGKLGCSALDGLYGNYCRVCYNDMDLARENDTEDDRAIMCDTLEPVVVYRRLNAADREGAPGVARKLQKWRENQRWKTMDKWQGDADNDAEPRWKREEKWKGNNDDTDDSNDSDDLPKWKQNEKWKSNVCDDGCESDDGATGRVCDTTCKDGDPYGKLGCSALDSLYGNYCRVCYNDVELARENDTEEDRAIMCDTLEPVVVYRRLNAANKEEAPGVARKLQKWRENQRWKTMAKWQGDADNDAEPRWKREEKWKSNNDDTDDSNDPDDLPKWKRTEKWKSNVCDDGCESDDGDTGRVCDTTCKDGDPYGKLGCSALDSLYGNYCRVCYNDIELARENDTEDDRAIMCDTLEPVVVYRRLNAADNESAPHVVRKLQKWRDNQRWKTTAKWQGDADNDTEPRWKQEQKWKGNNDDTDDSNDPDDLPKWKRNQKWKSNVCDDGCESNDGDTGRVCDTTCKDGDPYGKLGCSALDSLYGNYCRVCYNDVELARENDTEDDRAIMCDTLEPVVVYRRLNAVDKESASGVPRRLQKWRENQRWKTIAKWQGDADNDTEPRWKREEKWKGNNDDTDDSNDPADLPKWKRNKKWESNVCADGCETDDGDTGRVCDMTCDDGDPYGKLGCSALDSLYGNYCRVCYNDVELARENDTEDDRAIMCDTMEPVVVCTRRHLKVANTGVVAAAPVSGENAPSFFSEAAERPYTDELVRGSLCAFVSGRAAEVDQVEVTVMSILQFVPGMRVAVATEADGVNDFEMAVGDLPGVTVSSSANILSASLFADEYCGAGTSLIFYMRAGSVVSRAFTAKDTHSPRGDLLVVYSKDRTIRDERFVRETTVLLGFEAPSFTHGTDLILPVKANADLRNTLAAGSNMRDGRQAVVSEVLSKLKDRSAVPQMLAALQHSRNTPGVWFFNPQTWVSHNLFKTASIWEIPLVKPRFTCEIYPSTNVENTAVAGILQRNLDFFAMGGTCEDGLILQEP